MNCGCVIWRKENLKDEIQESEEEQTIRRKSQPPRNWYAVYLFKEN